MIAISSMPKQITEGAQFVASYIKDLNINTKVYDLFHATISAAQAHPYITIGLSLAAIYCYRGKIKTLIDKVISATQFLYRQMKSSVTATVNFVSNKLSSFDGNKTNLKNQKELHPGKNTEDIRNKGYSSDTNSLLLDHNSMNENT